MATRTARCTTVRFAEAVYVLHAFQKKSPSGIRTAKTEVQLVEERLKRAQRDYEERYGKAMSLASRAARRTSSLISVTPDAAERQAKLRLAYALNQVLDQREVTQTAAARLLGLNQPKVSALRNYKLSGFSLERLIFASHWVAAFTNDCYRPSLSVSVPKR